MTVDKYDGLSDKHPESPRFTSDMVSDQETDQNVGAQPLQASPLIARPSEHTAQHVTNHTTVTLNTQDPSDELSETDKPDFSSVPSVSDDSPETAFTAKTEHSKCRSKTKPRRFRVVGRS